MKLIDFFNQNCTKIIHEEESLCLEGSLKELNVPSFKIYKNTIEYENKECAYILVLFEK